MIKPYKIFALTVLGATVAAYSGVTAAEEIGPGWYIGIEGFSAKPKDGSGTSKLSASNGTTTVAPTASGGCPAGSVAVGLLDPANALVPSGVVTNPIAVVPSLCVIAPGSSTTPGTSSATGSSASSTSSVASKRGFGGGFNIGYLFSNGFRPELGIDYVKNDVTRYTVGGAAVNGADKYSLTAYRAMANAWYDINFGTSVRPYLGGGVGMQRSKFDTGNSSASANTFTYQLGGGLNFWATHKLALSLDYRYVVAGEPSFEFNSGASTKTTQTVKYNAQQFGIGLKYLFGEHEAAPPPAAPVEPAEVVVPVAAAEADTDGDGVVDSKDKCPDTPAGAKVNEAGCPLDSDGDGVSDDVDECPHTPAGAKVLANGCALAGDCRTPKTGEAADQNGCAVDKAFILKGVNFEFDSNRLTVEAKEILDGVADTLKSYADLKIEVAGHTDDVGTEAYNLGLSERRANAVKTYLASRGTDVSRLTPVGYGKTKPLVDGDTDEAHAKNRRVEFTVKE